jgi:hypothetical protein
MTNLKRLASCNAACAWAITAALAILAASPLQPTLASPRQTSVEFPFDLSAEAGDADTYEFKIASPGCILAQIRPWTATTKDGIKAPRLELAVLGADNSLQPRQAVTNSCSSVSPLWVSYAVFSGEAARVPSWTVRVSNPDARGTARGIMKIEYPPTQMPCALTARANRQGGVDLTWRHSGRPFSGSFLVERSTDNGATWTAVSTCTVAVSNNSAYECRDEGATITPRLLYRACAVTSGNVCSVSTVTPAVRVISQP